MSGVGGIILEVVVSVCGFVVNGSGYFVVGNRNTKVQEWYRGLACLKSILKSRMIGGTKMYEVLEILSSNRGCAKDVIDVPLVQGLLSSLIFFKHFSLDVTNKQARIVRPHFHSHSNTSDLLVIIAIKIKIVQVKDKFSQSNKCVSWWLLFWTQVEVVL